jgi:hypothetical protein
MLNSKRTREATYVKHNIEMRSRNIVAMQSNKYRILCVCVCVCVCDLSYPACNGHASYYIVVCDLSGPTIFVHVIS